jgi:HD-GYP domain-containing protein (c-di-GMP phosphodiesterase class II)
MNQNIHLLVAKRLFLGWLLLTVVIGGAVFYLETEKVDELVLDLAVKESKNFTVEFKRSNAAQMELLRQRAEEFLKGHFIVLELYDEHKRKILEIVDPGREVIEQKLKQYVHPFPLEDATFYKKFWIDRQLFLQVLLPLKEKNGELIGYFEGVYEVDAETLNDIEANLIRTLVLVLVAILTTTVMLYPIIISLNKGLVKLSNDLLKGNIELMDVLGSAIAKRDSDTSIHNYRVTIYAIRLAEAIGLHNSEIRKLISGAFLHDVGKIGISDNVLLKPGKLTDEEFAMMRNHVALGVDIIDKSNWLHGARDVVEFHHEKYDGGGYLQGLKGEEIPLNARIFAIVDVFDALTSKRPYKAPMPFEEAMAVLEKGRGSHFDPRLLDTFAGIAPELYAAVSGAEEREVEASLDRLVKKHFFFPTNAENAPAAG